MYRSERVQVQLDTVRELRARLNDVVVRRVARGETFTLPMVTQVIERYERDLEGAQREAAS